jgi:hypothetical protein
MLLSLLEVKETDVTGDAQHQEIEAIDRQPSEPTPIEIDDSITTSNTTETFETTDTDTDFASFHPGWFVSSTCRLSKDSVIFIFVLVFVFLFLFRALLSCPFRTPNIRKQKR